MSTYMFDLSSLSTHRKKHISFIALLLLVHLPVAVHAEEQHPQGDVSRYLSEVNNHDYIEVKAPSVEPLFRWDFSKKKVQTYSFEQTVSTKSETGLGMGSDSSDPEQNMSAKGTLLIKSQGDGTAELVLKDMNVGMQITINKAEGPKTLEQAMPNFAVQGVKEDGTGSFGDSSQDMLLKLIFPLPSKALKIGESVDAPAQIPFNAMGSLLQVTGRSRITLARYVLIGSRTCAQFDVDIDISKLKVPSELEGEYTCSAKGAAVFYFDVNTRAFVSGSTAFLMQFNIDTPTPKMSVQGEQPQDLPERIKMSMKSDNFIHVSAQE